MPAHCSGWEPGVNGSLSDAPLRLSSCVFQASPGVCVFMCVFVCLCGSCCKLSALVGGRYAKQSAMASRQPQFLVSLPPPCQASPIPIPSAPSFQPWVSLMAFAELLNSVLSLLLIEFLPSPNEEYAKFEKHTNHNFLSLKENSAQLDIFLLDSMCSKQQLRENFWKKKKKGVFERLFCASQALWSLQGTYPSVGPVGPGREQGQRSMTTGERRCGSGMSEGSEWREQSDGTWERWASYSHTHTRAVFLAEMQLWWGAGGGPTSDELLYTQLPLIYFCCFK